MREWCVKLSAEQSTRRIYNNSNNYQPSTRPVNAHYSNVNLPRPIIHSKMVKAKSKKIAAKLEDSSATEAKVTPLTLFIVRILDTNPPLLLARTNSSPNNLPNLHHNLYHSPPRYSPPSFPLHFISFEFLYFECVEERGIYEGNEDSECDAWALFGG